MHLTRKMLTDAITVSAVDIQFKEAIPRASGVYIILCNGYIYIGRSNNIRRRWPKHMFDLRRDRHANRRLQEQFNVSGEACLLVIYVGSQEDIVEGKLLKHFVGQKFCVNSFSDPHGSKGYKHADLRPDARLTQDQADSIRRRYNALGPKKTRGAGIQVADSLLSLAKEFGISYGAVRSIIKNKTYTHRAQAHSGPKPKESYHAS